MQGRLVEDASGRIRGECRRRLPVLGSCRPERRTWSAFSFGCRFLEARRGRTRSNAAVSDASRSKARRGPKIGSARPSSRVRLGAKALRCRERWCYRAMVPIPPNGPSPPSFPFALVLDLSSPPPSTFHLISPSASPSPTLPLFLFTYNCILTLLLTSTSVASPFHPSLLAAPSTRLASLSPFSFGFLPRSGAKARETVENRSSFFSVPLVVSCLPRRAFRPPSGPITACLLT